MGYDLYPLTTIDEKRSLLMQAVKGRWILFFEHDPIVQAATVRMTNKGFTLGDLVDGKR